MFLVLLLEGAISLQKANTKIPKIKNLFLYPEKSQSEIDEEIKKNKEKYDKNMEQCTRMNSKDMCEVMYSTFNPLITNKVGDELNNFLKTIPKDTEILMINSHHFNSKVDFKFLPSKLMLLSIMSGDIGTSSIDVYQKQKKRMEKKIMQIIAQKAYNDPNEICKILTPKKRKIISQSYTFSIVGNINNKVPFLYFALGNVRIVDSDLDCTSSNFVLTLFASDSKKIKSKYFIVEKFTHSNLDFSIIDVDQYSMMIFDFQDEDTHAPDDLFLRITYYEEKWQLYVEDKSQSSKLIDFGVPYTSAKSFGAMALCYHIDIICGTEIKIVGIKNVNISLMQSAQNQLTEDAKEVVYVKASGWASQSEKPNVYITVDQSKYKIDSSDADGINVKVESIYTPENKKSNKKTVIIVVVVVVVVVVIVVIIIVVVVIMKKKKKNVGNQSNEAENKDQSATPNQQNQSNQDNNSQQYPQNYDNQQYPQNYDN